MRHRFMVGLLVVPLFSSCIGGIGGPPLNGFAETVNLSRSPASFHWQSPGLLGFPLFGGSGTEAIASCTQATMFFGAGDNQLTVSSATMSRSFVLHAPANGQSRAVLTIVVTRDGGIATVDPDHVPPSPFCP